MNPTVESICTEALRQNTLTVKDWRRKAAAHRAKAEEFKARMTDEEHAMMIQTHETLADGYVSCARRLDELAYLFDEHAKVTT